MGIEDFDFLILFLKDNGRGGKILIFSHDRLHNLGLVESHGVNYKMEGLYY